MRQRKPVAPPAGTRIETFDPQQLHAGVHVAPPAGARIETAISRMFSRAKSRSRPPRARGLKLDLHHHPERPVEGRAPRGRED